MKLKAPCGITAESTDPRSEECGEIAKTDLPQVVKVGTQKMKTYQCECEMWAGERCQWQGQASEMVVVEWMPESIRSSHEAAGNRGRYPHNGSVRVAVESSCAGLLIEADPEWSEIIEASVEDYFDAQGRYKGADEHGIEPLFRDLPEAEALEYLAQVNL